MFQHIHSTLIYIAGKELHSISEYNFSQATLEQVSVSVNSSSVSGWWAYIHLNTYTYVYMGPGVTVIECAMVDLQSGQQMIPCTVELFID